MKILNYKTFCYSGLQKNFTSEKDICSDKAYMEKILLKGMGHEN